MSDQSIPFQTTLQRFDSDLWGYHIAVPNTLAENFLELGHKRVVCTLFGTVEIQCALMTRKQSLESNPSQNYFININKELRSRFRLDVGDEVEAAIRPDLSKYGLPMPEELEELLAQDPEGDQLFHALTPGKQRSLLFMVGKPKGTDTRLKKALVILDHLKVNQGQLDFRRLQADFKEANRR